MLSVTVQVGLGVGGLLAASTHGPPVWLIPVGVLEESTNRCGFIELLVTV